MYKVKVFYVLFFALSIFAAQLGCAKKIETAKSSASIEGDKAAGLSAKKDKTIEASSGGKEDKGVERKIIDEENVGKNITPTEIAKDNKDNKDNKGPESNKGSESGEITLQGKTGSRMPAVDKGMSPGDKERPVAGRQEGVIVQRPNSNEGLKKEEVASKPLGVPKQKEEGLERPNSREEVSSIMKTEEERLQSPDKEIQVAKKELGTAPETNKRPDLGNGGIPSEIIEKDKDLLLAPNKEIQVAKKELGTAPNAIVNGGEDPGLKDIFFDFDSWVIKGDFKVILEQDAKYLVSKPQLKVQIEGYADERGTDDYNLALGERRAKSTMNFLTDMGVNPERISIISYGEERPFCKEHEESCWKINRRGHFIVIDK